MKPTVFQQILLCFAICCVYMLMIALLPAQAEVFSFVDEQGKTHYVDDIEKIPPEQRDKALKNRTPLPDISRVKPGREEIYENPPTAAKPEARIAPVEVFVTDWCPYCKHLEEQLAEAGIPYQRYNIERDREAQALYRKLGGTGGVPLSRVNGRQVVRGADIDAIKAALGPKKRGENDVRAEST